ncbi:MAG: hypothetical protein A2Y38_03395 [Spirochaetes bacterium GWB1_59_5]|nr:MAG: hypothetical protein A2Y38_03395 [Spirochaetes bacterium GWB1_59_5]
MNIEFHYYAVYALALEAGFDENTAFLMAQSSQEVDDSTTALAFDTPRGRVDIAVTQNYLFWNDSVKRDIYLPFHFVPGDADEAASARADGRRNPYAVTPNSDNVKELLVASFKDKDPYLMGIAAHAFADSWAHQNFCGLLDESNDLGATSLAAGLPPAGHLQALSSPDDPGARWQDLRLRPERRLVVNSERFTTAATKLFRYLRVFLGRPFNDDELVVAKLAAIWAKSSKDERISDYVIGWNLRPHEARLWRREAGAPEDRSPLAGIRHYDKLAWARSQLAQVVGGATALSVATDASLYDTKLYHWHEAANEHRSRALKLIERKGL